MEQDRQRVWRTGPDVVVKASDMSEELQSDAIQLGKDAVARFTVEKDIAAYIKKEFDKRHTPTWHCIVGHSFGSYVTHESGRFLFYYIGPYAVLLFRSA